MNRLVLFIAVFALSYSDCISQDKFIPPVKRSFRNGEKLLYSIRYGFITGGIAELSVKQEFYGPNIIYHATGKATTTGLVDKIFNVVDIYESYFDMKSVLPVKAIRNIKENDYTYYDEVQFSRKDSSVLSSKSGYHKVPPNIFDMISVFYYLRCIDMTRIKIGDVIYIDTYFDDRVFPFSIRYKGIEIIETVLGDTPCHRFDPVVEPGRIFKSEDDMSVWFTNDNNMIPVLIKFDMIVGSIKCELQSYNNLLYPVK